MKIEIPASKSKEAIKVGEEPLAAPSLFIPNPDYPELCRIPVRVPVQEQRFVAKSLKNPMIFCSGFFIGLIIGVTAILIPNIVFPNENVFGICLRNEALTTKSNPDFDNPTTSHQYEMEPSQPPTTIMASNEYPAPNTSDIPKVDFFSTKKNVIIYIINLSFL